jgi:hypothetical protein
MIKNKKGFCVAPFRNAEFLTSGEVWQCVSGGWSEEEKRWINAWITSGPAGNVLKDDSTVETLSNQHFILVLDDSGSMSG